MDSLIESQAEKRLIVLIPDCLAVSSNLAREIHWMADHENRAVLYLVLADDDDNRLAVSRCMTTMKAVTAANRLLVDWKQAEPVNWLQTLQDLTCPGDVIVCQEEQRIVVGASPPVSVSEYLSEMMSVPVKTISGYYHPDQIETKQVQKFLTWIGFLVIVAVSIWLQVRLGQVVEGSFRKALITVMFCLELGAFWAWNKFTYRI